MRIFVSYGHDQHASLAIRLRDDLRASGHEAWFGEERLIEGYDWEAKIEEGLDLAAAAKPHAVLILLLTPHSVRQPNGYCLNEVARALSRGLRIIPLMVVEGEPPLSICRIQWLDMRECIPISEKQAIYEARFERLLTVIEDAAFMHWTAASLEKSAEKSRKTGGTTPGCVESFGSGFTPWLYGSTGNETGRRHVRTKKQSWGCGR